MPNADTKNTFYCSFCGRSQYEVKKLIAGPAVFICNECVFICLGIITEEEISAPEAVAKQARAIQREQAAANLARRVKRILKDEARRHEPYAELEEQLRAYEAVEEPPSESNPASIEKFPATAAAQPG